MEIGVGTTIGGVVGVVWRSTNVEKIKVDREHTTRNKGLGSPLTGGWLPERPLCLAFRVRKGQW